MRLFFGNHLNNDWPSDHSIIRHSLVAFRKNDIILSCNTARHLHSKSAIYWCCVYENWPCGSDKSTMQSCCAICFECITRRFECDSSSGENISRSSKRQFREGLERELWVWWRTRNDKWRCKGVHLVRAQRGIKRGREWSITQNITDIGTVACLNGEDRTRCR